MFEDSLFASNSVSNPRRGWTALTSFFVQTLFIGVLVALPLLFTEALPLTHLTDYPHRSTSCSTAPTSAEVIRSVTRGRRTRTWLRVVCCSLRAFPPTWIQVTDDRLHLLVRSPTPTVSMVHLTLRIQTAAS